MALPESTFPPAAERERSPEISRFDLETVAARSAIRAGISPYLTPDHALALLTEVLRAQRMPVSLMDRLLELATAPGAPMRLVERLTAAIGGEIGFRPIDEALQQPVLLLLGPPRAGRTTLAAKLAARFNARQVMVVSTDVDHADGLAQIEEYTNVLGVPLVIAEDVESLRRTVAGAAGRKVIIDTPAIDAADATLRDRLSPLVAAAGVDPVLVLPATGESEDAVAVSRAVAALGGRLLIVTQLDLVQRIGGVLAAAHAGRLAITATSVSPHFAFGLRPLTPEAVARRLLTNALDDER